MTAQAREQLLDFIASPGTRSALHAYVRRRGLSDSAEDLVQTALCDALAAQAVPVESTDLPRWLNGILRNKVVDERRRRARWQRAEAVEPTAPPAPVDALAVLRRIESEVTAPEERRALTRLVRESHARGRHVSSHCHATASIANSVEAGVDTIEHCSWLTYEGAEIDDELLSDLVTSGVVIVPTLAPIAAAVKHGRTGSVGAGMTVAAFYEHRLNNVRRMRSARTIAWAQS